MKLLAKCPKCLQKLELTANMADKRIRCPKCHELFKVPDIQSLNKAIEIIANARAQVYVDQDGKIYG